jgi:ketosteroid isomerase-like protein
MRTLRPLLLVAAALVTTSCADTPQPPAAAPLPAASSPQQTSTPAPDPAADEAAVEKVYLDYTQSLVDRDFATSCGFLTQEAVEQMLEGAKAAGAEATTCEDTLGVLYAVPEAAELGDEVARTTEVESVEVDGDTATVEWSAELNGTRNSQSSDFERVDGGWRLAEAS